MTIRNFITIFATAALGTWILDVIFLLILAAPLSWLWNHAVAPIIGSMPTIGYTRTVGLLLSGATNTGFTDLFSPML